MLYTSSRLLFCCLGKKINKNNISPEAACKELKVIDEGKNKANVIGN